MRRLISQEKWFLTDEEPPTIQCPPQSSLTVYIDREDETATLEITTNMFNVSDNFGALSLQPVQINNRPPTTFSFADIYQTYPFTASVRDQNNNVASCQAQVFVTSKWECSLFKNWNRVFQYSSRNEASRWNYNSTKYKALLTEFEPPHDKTNKMTVCLVKTRISLGICPVWSVSSPCAQWVAEDPVFLHADSKDPDQTGRMPKLIWVFSGGKGHFVGFVMRRLI